MLYKAIIASNQIHEFCIFGEIYKTEITRFCLFCLYVCTTVPTFYADWLLGVLRHMILSPLLLSLNPLPDPPMK